MTRGTFVLITDNEAVISIEFNGDMYPDGYGKDAKEALEKVNSKEEFEAMVQEFNKTHHNYPSVDVYTKTLGWLEKASNFNRKYFDNWFSDWLFIKNISKRDWSFTLAKTRKPVVIDPSGLLVVTFGEEPDETELKELGMA